MLRQCSNPTKNNEKISQCGSLSPKCAELAHFTTSFYRRWLIEVHLKTTLGVVSFYFIKYKYKQMEVEKK